jgi:redox-sensitive bicupin YhaK (pirin superfamily)
MYEIIRSDSRGAADHGWLQSKHTFSFADYHNPARMGFGSLRVVNEDWIEPEQGFGTHPHRDMEIVTYMIDGALEHKDNMGNGSIIRSGELQRMTAGTGVMHSEFNHSGEESAHLLQIWVLPERKGLQPGYEQKLFASEEKQNRWRVVASPSGHDGSLTIHQDIQFSSSLLDQDVSLDYQFESQRKGFLQIVSGSVEIDGKSLSAGDALTAQEQPSISIRALEKSELLMIDMA